MKEYNTYLEKNDVVSAFKMFLHTLPYIRDLNSHLRPQHVVLNEANIRNVNVLINVNSSDDVGKLEKLIKRELKPTNISNDKHKTRLQEFLKVDTRYLDLISRIYQSDAVFFKRYNININQLYESP